MDDDEQRQKLVENDLSSLSGSDEEATTSAGDQFEGREEEENEEFVYSNFGDRFSVNNTDVEENEEGSKNSTYQNLKYIKF